MTAPDELAARLEALEIAVSLLIASHHMINPDPLAAPGRFEQIGNHLLDPGSASPADALLREQLLRLQERIRQLQEILPPRLIDG